MADFEKGDTVKLKSGGPTMTIETIDARAYSREDAPKDHAWCQWFDKTKLETGVFPLHSLTKVDTNRSRVSLI